MGVPKFYRWISERYPCLSEVVKEHKIPEFDNLYLDMNGIIHQCSHPNDEDVHFRISEEKIFADIFHYIEVLFRIIKPRKVFFMAVDGVAPRAKMNQQRGRRFRSAKEAEEKIKKALEKGETLPEEARFDSNCITPGTEFMAKLHEQLKYFVNWKISTDKTWQGVNIYLSGHETPGEGEHKIMEFIRSEKMKPDHDVNTRHCLYGLDADLIMLGLTTHESHFSLLREEVRFGGRKSQKRVTAPEETTFHLLHLSLMREYIEYEFSPVKEKICFSFDIESIIDDWILMGFLVGNDFIPHLPHLHINHDALPLLYRTYMDVLPKLTGYINENGHLNLERFEKYLAKLAEFDREHFSAIFLDLKWFESKVGNKYLNEAAGIAAEEAQSEKERKQKAHEDALNLAALEKCEDGEECPKDLVDDAEDDDLFETEFRQHKRSYYMTKMGVEVVSDEFLADQSECYVQAIQWILHYYYHGVQSWSWYYPYHYAPYLSDIRNICNFKLKFELGKPFLPFQQLLAVLPAASKDLLPKCYQYLMTSEDSRIIEYYPEDFKTDLNGKQQEWEAVVLIPFIDEKLLLEVMEPCSKHLTEEERLRNKHSECLLYWYDKDVEFVYPSPSPGSTPAVEQCCARCKKIPLNAWRVDLSYCAKKVHKSSVYYCGFPTLKHIKHKFYLKKNGVQVFQQGSRGDNMMLEIISDEQSEEEINVENVAALVLGKSIFANWPHLEESRVVATSDGEVKFSLEEPAGIQRIYKDQAAPPAKLTYLGDKERNFWLQEVQGISEHYQKRKGVVINDTFVVVYAQLLTGRRYVIHQDGEVRFEKQWSKQVLPFAYQTIVKDINAFDASLCLFTTLSDLFPPGITVFMLGTPYYGCMGEVQDSTDVIADGRIRVVFSAPCEPQLDSLIQNQHKYSVKYNPGYVLASRLGISGYLVSRFSGSILIGRGAKKNPLGNLTMPVGLYLKFSFFNKEVPNYIKKWGNSWVFQCAVEQIFSGVLDRFPELFTYVSKNTQDDIFYEDDIWPEEEENGAEKVQEISSWLKSHPVSSSLRASCDLQILDEAVVEKIEEEIEACKQRKSNKKVRVTVKPHLLYRALEQQQGTVPDREADYRLFDRVVNIREGYSVPLGLRGTVIGIKGADREADVLYEVLFDEEFPGGLTVRCPSCKGYRLPACALINISHGSRVELGIQKLTAIVKPQPAANPQYSSYSVAMESQMKVRKVQLGGLNHSPQSPFVPTRGYTKQDDEFSSVWNSLQGFGKPPPPQQSWTEKMTNLPQEVKNDSGRSYQSRKLNQQEVGSRGQQPKTSGVQRYKQEHANLHGNSPKSKEEFRNLKQETQLKMQTNQIIENDLENVKILKRSHVANQKTPDDGQNVPGKPSTDFENIMASLSISRENEVSSPQHGEKCVNSEEHLSPQSFAMKGTQMLKEILKINGTDMEPAKTDMTVLADETVAPSAIQESWRPPPQNRKPKILAAHINKPQSAGVSPTAQSSEVLGHPVIVQQPPMSTPVSELSRICVAAGSPQPEYSFLRTPQGMMVCQVKLANGLLVHGPQCQYEVEAKEKAALFALQRLSSLGTNLPLPPPLFPNFKQIRAAVSHGTMRPVFCQSTLNTTNLMPSSHHNYGPVPWGTQMPVHGQSFYHNLYPGKIPSAGGTSPGIHSQFIPLQVTKKRASAKKNCERKDYPSPSQAVSQKSEHQLPTDVSERSAKDIYPSTSIESFTAGQPTINLNSKDNYVSHKGRPLPSSSRRKHRKLAANFNVSKPSE
ncbi:5'-3' exoribonuclease 1 [Protopterus annectens]|uniref:5'-3' exoribonuclease 1 n=1 Tax=Protopterus annectens TaxID=7888 RepID=UPI001CF99A6C|nr:5'-3' exoribonuclease 1 [Protopterus annectens]